MPEIQMKRIYNRILPQRKICFLSAVIIGLVTHMYKLTNWLPNWDSLVFRYDSQNMVSMGRWFLPVVCTFSSFYDLPWLTGLLAIVFHAAGAACICGILDVKKGMTAALVGAAAASFPTVTSVMMYNYVADGYAFAFLLACMAVAFLTGEKPRYLISAVLIALSTAIYQAYITVTVMLILLYLINEIIFGEKSVADTVKKSAGFLLTGIAGMALYYLIMRILPAIMGEELLDYQGFSSAASFSGIDIRSSLYTVVHTLIDYFFDFSKGVSVFTVLNCIIFAVTAALYLVCAVKNGVFASAGKILLLAVFVLLLPTGANILAFANPGIDYHNLMKMGYFVFYLFFVLLYERTELLSMKMRGAGSWLILVLCSVLVFNQTVIANISYHKLQMAYEKSYGVLLRIADRIEQTEGQERCGRILAVGALPGSEAYSDNLPPNMTGTTGEYILRADDEIVGQSVLCSALNDYCGKEYMFVHGEEKQALLKRDEVMKMDCWPGKNSVAVIDDVIVIKLGEERNR